MEAAADPTVPQAGLDEDTLRRGVRQQPLLARRMVALHTAYLRAQDQLRVLDDRIETGSAAGGPLPWEEVRDWFHAEGNYIDALDRGAERIAGELAGAGGDLPERLARDHGVTIRSQTEAVGGAPLQSEAARKLLSVGLANYAAGALLMPYARFRQSARSLRHDIDRLRQAFGVSFEQACHRLSTLQRTGSGGVPFFFARVDMAGNITKRHSATRLQFARFGGACPLWNVHEAAAIPDRILVQLAEAPDGIRYVMMAKGTGETHRQLSSASPTLCRSAGLRGRPCERLYLCGPDRPDRPAQRDADRHILPHLPEGRLRTARLPARRPRDRRRSRSAHGGALLVQLALLPPSAMGKISQASPCTPYPSAKQEPA
jgi:hypothetical protein